MSFDAFLKIDGIPGESTDSKHKDWIEILTYHHGVFQPASSTASSAGGGSSGRVDFGQLSITKLLDKATPKIFEACVTGKHIKEVLIELCRAGGDKQKYFEIRMEQVLIGSYVNAADSGATREFPSETITFSPGKFKITYSQQKREDGQGGGQVAAGWDLTSNKTC
jgi:type VI secretion system secreted protein Hcp